MRIIKRINRLVDRVRALLRTESPPLVHKEAPLEAKQPLEAKAPSEAKPPLDDGRVRLDYKGRTVVFEPFGGSLERILRTGVFYEAKFLEYIESLKLPGAYIDAGAYVGTHSLFFALFCPVTKVYSFEPRNRCFNLLRQNVEANGVSDRVVLHEIGLSDKEETVTVSLDRKDEVIRCSLLDALVDERVAVIKIDVEGMEPKVLEGARRILARDQPIVFLEAQTITEFEENKRLMATLGYRATGKVFNATPTYEFVPDK